MLSTQWTYHDPANSHWTTVEEFCTLMAVGRIHRPLTHINAEAENQRLFETQVEAATSRSLQDVRAAPPIYGDLHNCAGWPPSDSSSTVFDSATCRTMRSMCHERDVHSSPLKARVLPKSYLKTVDSLLHTDEPALSVAELTDVSQDVQGHHDRSKKHVYFAEQRSQAQRKQRIEASGCSFNGPIADVALVACGMSSTLFFAQNASSRSNGDTKLPLYRSLPLNVKYR